MNYNWPEFALVVLKSAALQFCWWIGSLAMSGAVLTFLAGSTHRSMQAVFIGPLYWVRAHTFERLGVMVHELSHAVFCLLFGHRLQKIKWFDRSAKSGAKGSVTHTYHPLNPYHRIGHFFIGLGPTLLAPILVFLMMLALFPVARHALSFYETPLLFYQSWLQSIAHFSSFHSWRLWLFWSFTLAVLSQVELSKEDVKQALQGLPWICASLLIINALLLAMRWTVPDSVVLKQIFVWIASVFIFAIALSLIHTLVFGALAAFFGLFSTQNQLAKS
jgi:hypothetical protein